MWAPAPRVAPAQRVASHAFVAPQPYKNVVIEIWCDTPIEALSCCIPYRLVVYHRRDQERLCRLCANTPASKSFKYQSAVLEAKILSRLEWWADIGGNVSSKARSCGMRGVAAEVDSWWSSRNLRDRLTSGPGTWLSSSPPIKPSRSPSPRLSSSRMLSWRSNAHLHLAFKCRM